MSTKRKTRKTKNAYQFWTHLKLALAARRLQKKIAKFAKSPAVNTYKGMTTAQQRKAIEKELAKVSTFLRKNTVKSIDTKIKTLKKQVAKQLNVGIASSKATSPAIKRLTAKRSTVSKSKSLPALVKLAAALKLSTYKNPTVKRTKAKVKARRTIAKVKARRTISKLKRAKTKATIKRRIISAVSIAKQKKLTLTLKREIQRLKQRNTAMRKLVAKFRADVAQMQRHYGTLSTGKPNLRLVNSKQVGKDVSNIVRFNNALNNVFTKQRKAG